MNELQLFNYEAHEVRVITRDNEPWWVLKDVCAVLGLSNPTVVAARLDADEVTKFDLGGLSGESNIINESGLYNVIVRSDKPEAKRFKRWVTHEVLPSIRKHGLYAIDEVLENPDLLINALTELKAERARTAKLQSDLDESKDWFTIKRAAFINHVEWKSLDWRKLKYQSVLMNRPVKKIFDANYGEVNLYHRSVFEAVYPKLALDGKA
jgi:prophage antirepressor-like protein